ncbi:hypothetical protein GCM10010517_71200 [Streptosporangium fragile]|uniref:N-acetyltransferase domain-containing protein n=1 Tax=Streptosporangium fragile TaxID=46186 RepID=A0ABN3W7N6_9ACTN
MALYPLSCGRALYDPWYIERTIRDFHHPDRVEQEVGEAPPHWFGHQVVEEAGRVLGAAGGGMTGPGIGELFVVHLDPGERNRGLGTLLPGRVTAQVSAAGAKERQLWSSGLPVPFGPWPPQPAGPVSDRPGAVRRGPLWG